MRILKAGTTEIRELTFSPSGDQLLVASGDYSLKLYPMGAEEPRTLVEQGGRAFPAHVFARAGRAVAVSSATTRKYELRIIDLESDLQEHRLNYSLEPFIALNDGMTIIGLLRHSYDVICLEAKDADLFNKVWQNPKELSSSYGSRISVMPDPEYFLIYNESMLASTLILSLVRTGQKVAEYPCPVKVVKFACSPNSDFLFAISNNKINAWSVNDLSRPEPKLRSRKDKVFADVSIHPSGQWLALVYSDAEVDIYETSTWELTRTFEWNIGRIGVITFSSDGLLLAAGGHEGEIMLWDFDE